MYMSIAMYTLYMQSYTAIYVTIAYMYNDPNNHVIELQVVYF